MQKYPFTKQQGLKECGPACVQMILKFYGGYMTINKLSEILETNQNGTTALSIVETLNNIGFESRGVKPKSIYVVKTPCIAHTIINDSYKHYIVIYKIEKDKLLIADPMERIKKISLNEFKKIWSGVIIEMHPIRKIICERKPQIRKLVLKYIKKHIKLLTISVILSLLISILSLFTALYLPLLTTSNNISKLSIVFLIIYLLKITINIIKNKFTTKLNINLEKNMNEDIFKSILNLPYRFYHRKTTGEITSYIHDLENIKLITQVFPNILINVLLILFLFIVFIYYNPLISFITFLYIIILLIILKYTSNKIKINTSELLRKKSEMNSYIVETISGFETLKNLNIISKINTSFIKKQNDYQNSHKSLSNNYIKQNLILEILYIAVLFISIMLSLNHNPITTYILLSILLESINQITIYNLDFIKAKESLTNIAELINIKPKHKKSFNSKGNIVIKNLTYSFKHQKVLNNINLKIDKGSKVMVTGTSGSGKSTLFKIIKGYYDNYSGSVKINNKEIKYNYSPKILYVCPNEILFTGTLKDNLYLKGKTEDICEVKEIADENYIIEENGFNLSNGQKQRIILQRSLHDFDILIIDEGLSQVSVDMERRILKRLFKYNKTIIYISHRLDNLDLFDQMIKLENGKKILDVKRSEKGVKS